MNQINLFSTSPKPSLTREGVIEVLLEWQNLGWTIHADQQGNRGEIFTIVIAANYRIQIHTEGNGTWILTSHGIGHRFGYAANVEELRARLSNHARNLNIPWPSSPSVARLSKQTPASNYGTIQRLTGNAKVEAVYDVYLDDKGIDTLLTLKNLGTTFSSNLRLLSSGAKAPNKLKEAYVSKAFIELGCPQGEVKYIPDKIPGHEYRFFLLNDGKVLLLGASLNNLGCNDSVHHESDKNERAIFEDAWSSAMNLEPTI